MDREDTDDFEFRVESRLTSHGVYVEEVREEEGAYHVTYESMAAADGVVPPREVGRVINVFRDLHADDWQGADIDGVVKDLDGDERGRWHVEAEWIAALHDGDLSETDFSAKVIDAIET